MQTKSSNKFPRKRSVHGLFGAAISIRTITILSAVTSYSGEKCVSAKSGAQKSGNSKKSAHSHEQKIFK